MQGLVQLDLNVPYLPEGAAALLAEAAALQATAAASSNQRQVPHITCQPPPGVTCRSSSTSSKQAAVAAAVRQPFSVGVWVCCWGGCTGINLSDACGIQQQLQAVGCSLHGIESVNCHDSREVARMGAALAELPGLKALGFNYRSSSSSGKKEQDHSSTTAASPAAAMAADSSAGSSSSWQGKSNSRSLQVSSWLLDDNTAALASLVPLHTSLQQLTVHGHPPGGFMQSSCPQCSSFEALAAAGDSPVSSSSSSACAANQAAGGGAAAEALAASCMQHPLAALTGLTKLQLLKQLTIKPLPLGPIAHLTGLIELTVERLELQHPRELACLSTLTRLTRLSLVLDTTADALLQEVRQRQWQLDMFTVMAAAAAAAEDEEKAAAQQKKVDEVRQMLRGLLIEQHDDPMQSAAAAAAGETAGERIECSSCCCCLDAGSAHSSTAATTAAAGDTVVPLTASTAAGDVWQQVMQCPYSAVSSPALLDWRWLRQLQQLQVAWLQVPHLDLACLPASLTELDVQQPHDLTTVSITCSSSSRGGVRLPSLKRLVLPRTVQVSRMAAAKTNGAPSNAAEEGGVQADDDAAATATQQGASPADNGLTGASEDSSGCTDDDDERYCKRDSELAALQLHHHATLLLELAVGCPELQELELVQWQLPLAAVLAAARQLRYLKLLSLLRPGSKADEGVLQQQLAAAKGGSVKLKLQEQLVLSEYPWSSVLAVP
jgi:hypothetical protein